MKKGDLKISILYDNRRAMDNFTPGMGFSAHLELPSTKVLFDLGADSLILKQNMEEMGGKSRNTIRYLFLTHTTIITGAFPQ